MTRSDKSEIGYGAKMRRRTFLVGAAGAAGVVAAPSIITKAKAAEPLTLVSYGGRYREHIEQAFVRPFAKETGIDVIISDTPDYAKLKAMVQTGNVTWDVFDAIGSYAAAGQKAGLFEPLDPSIVETPGLQAPVTDYIVGFYVWAGGFAWMPQRTPQHPTNFEEVWDVETYPGRRAFRARAYETLEIALVADGVAPNDLYPLDVDRAFASLDRIKKYVSNWVSATPQTIHLLRNGQTDFSYTYSGRVAGARNDGINIDMAMQQTVNGTEYLTVPKGTKRREAAMRFINFALRPERQAEFARLHYVNPARKAALDLLPSRTKKWVPNLSSPKNVMLDDFWWGEHKDTVGERFKLWTLT